MFLITIVIFALGLSIGSMLNAYIWRLSIDSSIWRGRSVCTSCRKQIAWHDLIPVLSYIFLRGKCRHCSDKISIRYPLVEIITALLTTVLFLQVAPNTLQQELSNIDLLKTLAVLARNWYFVAILVILFFTDLKWMTIPDRVTIPAILTAYVINGLLFYNGTCADISLSCIVNTSWTNYLLAMLVGGGFFWLQYVFSRGRWVGGGDIRFGALLGVMFGFPLVLPVLMLAYMLGTFIAVPLLMSGKKTMKSEVPFGIFLAMAACIVLIFESNISTYLSSLFLPI